MIESLECRRLLANFSEMLAAAQSYKYDLKGGWITRDKDPGLASTLDDLLVVMQGYRIPDGNVVSDWELALRLINTSTPSGDPLAILQGDKLVIKLPNDRLYDLPQLDGETTLSARVSSTGQLRIFQESTRLYEYTPLLVSLKASRVKSIYVVDGTSNNVLRLDDTFPAASIFLIEGSDKVFANNQPNTIYGGPGDDSIYAGGGDDVVYGDEGSDRLYGEGGNDTLFGGVHKDFLNGGSGKNILVGGSGTDYFTVRSKDKTDREPRDHVSLIT